MKISESNSGEQLLLKINILLKCLTQSFQNKILLKMLSEKKPISKDHIYVTFPK